MSTHSLHLNPPANLGAFEGDFGNPEKRGYGYSLLKDNHDGGGDAYPYRGGGGGRRGGFSNGEAGSEEGRTRRTFDRQSATGRGGGVKREGSRRGNWGTKSDEIAQVTDKVANETKKKLVDEKPAGEKDAPDGNKKSPRIRR